MAFVSDTFTDTTDLTLASHTGEVGATWTKHGSHAGLARITSQDRLHAEDTGDVLYYASGIPASADYQVQAVVRKRSASAIKIGVCARVNTAADTFYEAIYADSTGTWRYFKRVAGVNTEIGTGVAQTLTIDQEYTILFDLNGTALKLYVDTVLKRSETDAAISAAGRVGIRIYGQASASETVEMDIDSFITPDPATSVSEDNYSFPMQVTAQKRFVTVFA